MEEELSPTPLGAHLIAGTERRADANGMGPPERTRQSITILVLISIAASAPWPAEMIAWE